MIKLNVSKEDKILVIAPHPDDECIGVGGLLAVYARQCDIWVLTDGSKGCSGIDVKTAGDIRKKEFISEMETLKPNAYRMFGYTDSELEYHKNCLIKEDLSRYSMIFVTNEFDRHKDHQAAFCAVKCAVIMQGLKIPIYEYEVSEPLAGAMHYFDITNVVEEKKKYISCHASQLREFDYYNMALSLNSYRSAAVGKKNSYFEAYRISDEYQFSKEMKPVLIFGRGKQCKIKFQSISREYAVVGFLDNAVNEKQWDETFRCPVYPPGKALDFLDVDIICASVHYVEMWQQLKEIGVADERIHFAFCLPPYDNDFLKYAFEKGQTVIAKGDTLWYCPISGRKYPFVTYEELAEVVREELRNERPEIENISRMGLKPVSRIFGIERGKAIDRYYIERFLEENKQYVCGTVMEIGTNAYMRQFGQNKVTKEIILHVDGSVENSIKGNFETGEGIEENMADCLICTQTLQYIFDLPTAIKNIYKLLKSGGTALITVPGIKSLCFPDAYDWGERWSFTVDSMRELCQMVCDDYEVQAYGNVKTAIAYLYGLCQEDLHKEDFEYHDPQFPFIVVARISKKK